ncbi:MAG TPA: histidine triad nucleotide-binding protein [Jatrophihabitans sp.]|jgi:histidine triad (HIT) family protein|uniref:histidine triad nucleotide-binding protein n=1 Tax=Jatrophihabitans sp. TaxID=1932789 RepID=UPI002F02DBB0
MVQDCLFCKIVAGEVPATVVLEDADWLAFEDIAPKAPVHVLVIPKRHLVDIGELGADPALAAAVVAGIGATARHLGLPAFRTVFNTGAEAGQAVFHLHAHVLGGRSMNWPPG